MTIAVTRGIEADRLMGLEHAGHESVFAHRMDISSTNISVCPCARKTAAGLWSEAVAP